MKFADVFRPASAKLALAILLLVTVLTLFGPLLAPLDPYAQDTSAMLQGTSFAHPLGTDELGRDVLSRLLTGSPLSVLSALMAVAVGLVLGVVPALLSVHLSRVFEWFALRVTDALMTLPFLVFAIAMTALMGNGVPQAMLAVGILISPAFFRVTRAAALTASSSQYVEAAELMGASTTWILRRHVWRHVVPAVAVTAAGLTGTALVIVASLTFLGIGVVPPEPTWGGLLASDLKYLYQRPLGPLAPALLIVATVWAFNALADALRDAQTHRSTARSESTTPQEVSA
ncbi:ABC transporter permease [Microbacterium sp. A93]|uniref:ABC transporter permease n=1 Tax=unclassified Microbacterium TaxID=2609290 RepID=UPI003F44196C